MRGHGLRVGEAAVEGFGGKDGRAASQVLHDPHNFGCSPCHVCRCKAQAGALFQPYGGAALRLLPRVFDLSEQEGAC